jgi:regulator of sigma E protease
MEIAIRVAQFILSLSILIILHELGHFIPAKLFKTRVEKFYLFFDPWFSLFKRKKGETEYGIGWLPLGGYVKISGMIDESMDREQMKLPPQPWEFRSKPTWQRLIIMIGGVVVNMLLGIVIYIGLLYVNGDKYLNNKDVKFGIQVDSLAYQMGLRDGDKIVSVEGKTVENFEKIPLEIILSQAKTIEVMRDEKSQIVAVPSGIIAKMISKPSEFIFPRFPFTVEDFPVGSVGQKAGLMKGDKLIAINEISTPYFNDFKRELQKNKNKNIQISVIRNNKNITINATVPETGLLGIVPSPISNFITLTSKNYTFFEAIPAGTQKAFKTVSDYVSQFKLIFNRETKGYESLGGFVSIAKVFPNEWDWSKFWSLTAFLSIVLAFMNILPIPALDGGHVLFLLYEIITKRKPNEKFLEYAQTAGMILLLSLLIFANGNDILKLIKG